ncbi:ABC-2 transporter permease [Clostridium sp.]|uniref:ABC-2 transporter permease n=1 Tax=Clostridium sp. TaxID=1506 RepID=UPI003F2FDB98
MDNILKLVRLQFNTLFTFKKNLLIMLGLSLFMLLSGPTFIPFISGLYLLTACYNTMFYEEKSKINYLIYSLPINPKDYVLSKYIYCAINTLIAVIISALIYIGFYIFNIRNIAEVMTFSASIFSSLLMGLFFIVILCPTTLLLGFEKGRYVLVLLAVLPLTLSPLLVEYLPTINITLNTGTLTIIGILSAITLILISYFIASNLFNKKEIE